MRNLCSIIVEQLSKRNIKVSDRIVNWISEGERDYSTLPNILLLNNGEAVNSVSEYEIRRKEILRLFEENIYGAIPVSEYSVEYELIEQGINSEYQVKREQVEITVTTNKGKISALMLMYIPQHISPKSAIIGLNFLGNHTVANDKEILYSYSAESSGSINYNSGVKSARWHIAELIKSGYVVATMCYEDWAEDNRRTYKNRLINLFNSSDFKAISAWSFGLMRGIDYLFDKNGIKNIACVGHSRLGKASLWAGANDERISLVISNGSGNTGSAISRSCRGETVRYINLRYPYWFVDKYKGFMRNIDILPLDQHMLIAAIAPRQVYLGNAKYDLWADPKGSFYSLQLCSHAYKLFGIEAINSDYTMPNVDAPQHTFGSAFHLREGAHDITPVDWQYYLMYMNRYWNN